MNIGRTRLSELALGQVAFVDMVDERKPLDPIAARLRDLGFVRGEPVRVVAIGPLGGDPLLIQVGFTRFALRHGEASRVMVDLGESGNAGR
jgi:ferrous iron transport protein A